MKATIKNIFKKVDNYNEVAQYMGNRGLQVKVQFGHHGFGESFASYAALKTYMKEEFYPEFISTFEKVEIELDEETHFTVNYTNGLGTIDEEVTVWLSENSFVIR